MKKDGSDNPAYLHASWIQLYDTTLWYNFMDTTLWLRTKLKGHITSDNTTSENPNQTDTPQVKSNGPKSRYQKNDPILSIPDFFIITSLPCYGQCAVYLLPSKSSICLWFTHKGMVGELPQLLKACRHTNTLEGMLAYIPWCMLG